MNKDLRVMEGRLAAQDGMKVAIVASRFNA